MMVLLINLTLVTQVFADQASFDTYRNYAQSIQEKTSAALNDPIEGIDDFAKENVPESTYLNQSNETIARATRATAATNTQSQLIRGHFESAPLFLMRPDEKSLQHGVKIMSDANAIVSGKAGDYASCQSLPTCETTYEQRQCQESALIGAHNCKKRLQIEVAQQPVVDEIIRVYVSGHSKRGTVINFNLRSAVFSGDTHMSNLLVRIDPSLPASLEGVSCEAIESRYAGAANYEDPRLSGNNRTERFTVQNVITPSCANDWQGRVAFYQHRHRGWYKHGEIFYYRIRSQPPPKIKREYWQNSCALFENEPLCEAKASAQCTQGYETRIIDGVNVTRDCWEKKQTFICGRNPNPQNSSCAPLRDQGCEQVNSQCAETDPQTGACRRYQQTLRCPKQQCDDKKLTIKCDNKKPFCIDGDCGQMSRNNFDVGRFQKDVSLLSAIFAAAKDYNGDRIFTGHSESCEKAVVNAKDCCKDKGWFKKLGSNCSTSSKRLAEFRSRNLCVYVGNACDKRFFGQCILKRRKYCCFDSKLSRLVQQQGKAQLSKNFGSGKHPDCSGFTVEELQRLDFVAMDLSRFYQDLSRKINVPEAVETNLQAQKRIQKLYNEGRDL